LRIKHRFDDLIVISLQSSDVLIVLVLKLFQSFHEIRQRLLFYIDILVRYSEKYEVVETPEIRPGMQDAIGIQFAFEYLIEIEEHSPEFLGLLHLYPFREFLDVYLRQFGLQYFFYIKNYLSFEWMVALVVIMFT